VRDPANHQKPWAAGWAAAKANLLPGLLLQSFMLGLLLAYFYHPPATRALNQLAEIKQAWGYGYSALSAILAGAFIPEILRVLVFQHGRPSRQNAANLAFTIPFWCFMGLVVDAFYRLQAGWFGHTASPTVVIPKVMVDQFLYNPLFAAPFTAVLYDVKASGYQWQATLRRFSPSYYRAVVVPTLIATWGVWIPVVSILYSLPGPLQIPLFGLALSLWVMIYTWMSEARARPHK
jgi:hypothetical protein